MKVTLNPLQYICIKFSDIYTYVLYNHIFVFLSAKFICKGYTWSSYFVFASVKIMGYGIRMVPVLSTLKHHDGECAFAVIWVSCLQVKEGHQTHSLFTALHT